MGSSTWRRPFLPPPAISAHLTRRALPCSLRTGWSIRSRRDIRSCCTSRCGCRSHCWARITWHARVLHGVIHFEPKRKNYERPSQPGLYLTVTEQKTRPFIAEEPIMTLDVPTKTRLRVLIADDIQET